MKNQHSVTRRSFIRGALASPIAISLASEARGNSIPDLRMELESILASRGVDLSSGTASVLAIISDPHIMLGTEYPSLRTEKWDDILIDEVNGLRPPVTHAVIAGDLISYRSMSPGLPRYGIHEAWAIQEYALAQVEVQRFTMPLWMIPGNHDTDAYETDAEMFKEKMGCPAYQRIELGGVPVLLLNTGNAGMLNREQEIWLRNEAIAIPRDQEVLIIQHIPTFFHMITQAGSKRTIAEAFRGRTAPVFIASGHNHMFAEAMYEYDGTQFIQMATTTANRLVFSDKKNPGYLLLALQDGKVVARIQRSLTASSFWPMPAVGNLVAAPLRFPFESIQHRIRDYEEGFYEMQGLIEFSGVHVGCYIAYCKLETMRIAPSAYYGKIKRVVIAASISASEYPKCWLSRSGKNGPWEELVFPPAAGSALYQVVLPDDLNHEAEFFLKLDTGLTGNVRGFSFAGWSLVSDASSMSGYEKWLFSIYGTLEKVPSNSPDAIVKGGNAGNLLTYAFNLSPFGNGLYGMMPRITSVANAGQDSIVSSIEFVRLIDRYQAGITYLIEGSEDLESWTEIAVGSYDETVLWQDKGYEMVHTEVTTEGNAQQRLFRVRVDHVGISE